MTSLVPAYNSQKVFKRPPADDEELWWTVRALWGVKIPRHSCCPEHTAPFDAFAEAYFARTGTAVWKASRGFGGKSFQLALLSATEAVLQGAQVALLGGSGAQSANVHTHMQSLWHSPNAPLGMLETDNKIYMALTNSAFIKALTASQKSVRGPHPQRLRMDEIDEMELGILEAAQGQTMRNREKGIETNTVLSSTHQYPDKCARYDCLVLTDRGEVAIEDVTADDRVMTRKGWRKVKAVTFNGYRETIELTMSNGRVLAVTDDHRIAVPGDDKWSIPRWMSEGQEVIGINSDPSVPLGLPTLPYPAPVAINVCPPTEPVFVVSSHTNRVLQPVYDLEVEDVHEFVAEGVVVHNTMSIILTRAKERGWPIHEWCIAQGSQVTTNRGQVAIELVGLDDLVLTRRGWRQVQHVTEMGTKETLILTFADGRKLRCTPDHLLHTPTGWITADSALSVTSIGTGVPITASALETSVALDSVEPASTNVLGMGDQLQVLIADARPLSAEMVEVHVGRDGAVEGFPQQLVSHNGLPFTVDLGSLPPIPVDLHAVEDVASGFHTHHSTVVSVERAAPISVWDIGVHGEHEFFVNGLLVHNCWKCTSNPIDGWLEESEVARKRLEVTQAMWDAEYDLQEPSFEGRAIDTDLVDLCFDESLGYFEGKPDQACRIMEPPSAPTHNNGLITAIDWGKERHWSVVATFDTRVDPWVCVAWKRFARQAWPVLIRKGEAQAQLWGGKVIHDATGIGNVIADHMTIPSKHRIDQTLGGASRTAMFNEYIAAIEHRKIKYPRIQYAYDEHRYVTDEDLFMSSGHPPDSFIVGALAWSTRNKKKETMTAPHGTTRASAWLP